MKLVLTEQRPAQFLVICDRINRVVLQPIEHEQGRFIAISETNFRCVVEPCRKRFSSRSGVHPCPQCGGAAEAVCYMVNVMEPHGNPVCSCESFTTKRGEVECKHGGAALYLFGKLMAAKLAEKPSTGP
jgi:hypothetical protein